MVRMAVAAVVVSVAVVAVVVDRPHATNAVPLVADLRALHLVPLSRNRHKDF